MVFNLNPHCSRSFPRAQFVAAHLSLYSSQIAARFALNGRFIKNLHQNILMERFPILRGEWRQTGQFFGESRELHVEMISDPGPHSPSRQPHVLGREWRSVPLSVRRIPVAPSLVFYFAILF